MKLINAQTGKEIRIGDEVTTFRGTKGRLKSAHPGHWGGSGKVTVTIGKVDREYYPSVIGATFAEDAQKI